MTNEQVDMIITALIRYNTPNFDTMTNEEWLNYLCAQLLKIQQDTRTVRLMHQSWG